MDSGADDPYGPGFPIQRSPDQRLLTASPKLFAGSHVFHRCLAPRHPPWTLIHLTNATLKHWMYLPKADTQLTIDSTCKEQTSTTPKGRRNMSVTQQHPPMIGGG